MSNRAAIREYVNGSLWVLPMGSGLVALLVGYAVSLINVAPVRGWRRWPTRAQPAMREIC